MADRQYSQTAATPRSAQDFFYKAKIATASGSIPVNVTEYHGGFARRYFLADLTSRLGPRSATREISLFRVYFSQIGRESANAGLF